MKNTMLKKSCKLPGKLQKKTLPHATLGHLPGFNFQVYASLLLQITDHRKQITRLGGVPFWPEHTHEALARLVENPGQFLEPECGNSIFRHVPTPTIPGGQPHPHNPASRHTAFQAHYAPCGADRDLRRLVPINIGLLFLQVIGTVFLTAQGTGQGISCCIQQPTPAQGC